MKEAFTNEVSSAVKKKNTFTKTNLWASFRKSVNLDYVVTNNTAKNNNFYSVTNKPASQ
jgi:hypothetical protein